MEPFHSIAFSNDPMSVDVFLPSRACSTTFFSVLNFHCRCLSFLWLGLLPVIFNDVRFFFFANAYRKVAQISLMAKDV